MDNLNTNQDKKELRVEKSLYKANDISYYLIMLAILLNGVFLIQTLNIVDKTFNVGLIILFNIFISLLLFLTAVRVKSYTKPWTYVAVIVGGIQVIRAIFFIPENATTSKAVTLLVLLLVSAIALVVSAIYAYGKIILQEAYKAKHANDKTGR